MFLFFISAVFASVYLFFCLFFCLIVSYFFEIFNLQTPFFISKIFTCLSLFTIRYTRVLQTQANGEDGPQYMPKVCKGCGVKRHAGCKWMSGRRSVCGLCSESDKLLGEVDLNDMAAVSSTTCGVLILFIFMLAVATTITKIESKVIALLRLGGNNFDGIFRVEAVCLF